MLRIMGLGVIRGMALMVIEMGAMVSLRLILRGMGRLRE